MNILKSKTAWTGLAAIVSAGAGYASGDFTAGAAVQTGFMGLISIFLRMAIDKAGVQ